MLFVASINCKSQGFNWQFDPRLPFKTPIFFYGLNIEYGILSNYGEILFSEGYLPCCTFKEGNGSQIILGAHSEYWESSNLAYNLDVSLLSRISKFLGYSDTLPIKTGEKFITRYEFNSNISGVLLEPGIKYKISNTHLNISLGLQLGLQFAISTEHNEYVISPDNWPWKSKNLSNTLPFDLNNIFVNPRISIGYDYSIADGLYLTPSLSYSLPIISIASQQKWRYQSISLKFALNYGAFKYIE